MERKIGEIFEYNDEWYQTVKSQGKCCSCDFMIDGHCIVDFSSNGSCFYCHRKDKENVIFKKLEKVGEPYEYYGYIFQEYHVFEEPIFTENYATFRQFGVNSKISIEVKQNKEDMEEKKTNFVEEIEALCKRYNMSDGVRADFISEIKEIIKDKDKIHSLKPFDLEAAKQGKPVCTRDGRKARIICFDAKRKDGKKIIALVPSKDYPGFEDLIAYPNNGNYHGGHENDGDLMMSPEKKEGWVNVYSEESNNNERLIEQTIYKTRKDAFDKACPQGYITTTKINWEE